MKATLIVLGVCALVAVVLLGACIIWLRKIAFDTSDVFKEYPTSIEEILAQLKEDDLVTALDQKIDQKWARSGYDSLTGAEKVFRCVHGVHVEIANGGFDQYFYNSEGDFAQDAPAAFKAIGADLIAGIVSRACSVFPDGKPPRDREERQQLLLDIGEEGKQLLDLLSGEFHDNQLGQGQILEDYIIEHKVEFQD